MTPKLWFKPIDGVNFQPWVGEKYKKSRTRLLVVGMSHYRSKHVSVPDFLFTNQVVLDRISGGVRLKFFTNIAATCIGRIPNGQQMEEFWRSIAFYNYIQSFVGDEPRKLHNYELWERSHPAFEAVLNRLRPRLIMVVGILNWGNISNLDGWAGDTLVNAPEARYTKTRIYPLGRNHSALAFHVKHTSSGYNFRDFARLYRSAVKRIRA